MKVAFASTDGKTVNEHFGRCGQFIIYEIGKDCYRFLEIRQFSEDRDRKIEESKDNPELHNDFVWEKVKSLSDCKIIYMTEIGPPSAARLSQKGIMPLKVMEGTSVEECLEKLYSTIKTSPPPWLKKLINKEEKS
ncbi:nitrogen fixation protein NifX [Thermodesulfovibrio aggregans]|uniref:Nitrogen fixation protein NifX n=1 Tax=Thermodesulfovibrio aggregans TaxID=86166 RepID=A0A0U9HXA1_9BACT|nr:nitrogen fixation protein NifX [Thermodesulfovibrio aggregans]GAQ95549.1 nitrogen fixation protein NifX [Thermodesulfovibrio aggregans]